MNLRQRISMTILSTALIASLGPVSIADAAVVTGANPLAGFSVVTNDFFDKTDMDMEEKEDSFTELFSKVSVPDGIAFTNVTDSLNVRKGPGTNYARVGKMGKNAYCIVESVENGWAKITSGKVKGYCSTEYLIMGNEAKELAETLGTVMATVKPGITMLNVRSAPDTTEDNVIAKISAGQNFKVVKEIVINKNDPAAKTFVQIAWNTDTNENNEAYVCSDYVNVSYKYNEAVESSSYGDNVSQLRTNIIDYGIKFLGTKYVWGGNSLTKGVDCSGFVTQVFKNFGYTALPRCSRDMAKKYKTISASEAKAGDLVFYHNLKTGVVDHVAIYMGNGKIIHSYNGVEISSVNFRKVYKYARVIND